jgi:BirA family transcriptional regulator, biotin operon repressor / biotin---[acetyl-CoA-carboxylase] ligase
VTAIDRSRLGADDPGLMPDLTLEVHDTLESTHAEALRRAREGAPDGLVVVADHQTSGRGRLDRTWETPAGTAVTFSLVLRPEAPPRDWPWLPLLTGYAVDKALKASGLDAGVKWPNDVLVGDHKVAGILVERVETDQGPAAVVGVGINVSQTRDQLPVENATSLELELGRSVDRTDVLVECLNAIREAVDAWDLGGEQASTRLWESYAAACVTVGRDVRVDLPDGTVLEGRAAEVDRSGALVVEEGGAGGARRAVSAGDVVHVRVR